MVALEFDTFTENRQGFAINTHVFKNGGGVRHKHGHVSVLMTIPKPETLNKDYQEGALSFWKSHAMSMLLSGPQIQLQQPCLKSLQNLS